MITRPRSYWRFSLTALLLGITCLSVLLSGSLLEGLDSHPRWQQFCDWLAANKVGRGWSSEHYLLFAQCCLANSVAFVGARVMWSISVRKQSQMAAMAGCSNESAAHLRKTKPAARRAGTNYPVQPEPRKT